MEDNRIKIFAIFGSTRSDSANLHILNSIATIYAEKASIMVYAELDRLPHFNPDLDNEAAPPSITHFRKQIQDSDGVLICTPEYVYSLPGSFKNAIEWTVSTILFTNKPVALITAASSGQKAHEALASLMMNIGAKISASLLIQAPKTKVSVEGKITDNQTLLNIQQLMDTFITTLSEN